MAKFYINSDVSVYICVHMYMSLINEQCIYTGYCNFDNLFHLAMSDDPIQEAVMKKFQPKLLDLATLLPHLNNHNLLTATENYHLMNNSTPSTDRAQQLVYSILPSKGPHAFTLFFECLKKEKEHIGHQELVKMILPLLNGCKLCYSRYEILLHTYMYEPPRIPYLICYM